MLTLRFTADDTTSSPPAPSKDPWDPSRSTEAAAAATTAASGSSATSAARLVSNVAASTAAGSPPLSTTAAPTSTKAGPKTVPAVPTGAISVQCRGAAITVTVARDFLLSACIRENSLYLGLLECGVNGGSSTHVQLTVGWSECNTRLAHVSFTLPGSPGSGSNDVF